MPPSAHATTNSRGRFVLIWAILGAAVVSGQALGAGLATPWRQVWEEFDRTYSYFSHKKVDWDKVWIEHQADFDAITTPNDFAEKLNDILQVLRDWHVTVRKPDGKVIGYRAEVVPNYHPTKVVFARYADGPPYENLKNAGAIVHGWVSSNIAHVVVLTLSARFSESITEQDIDNLFAKYRSAQGMILDLRANGGGNENHAKLIAERFTDEPRIYGYVRSRIPGPDRNAFTDFVPKTLVPSSRTRFKGNVVCLVGQRTISSAEAFALMIRALPQGTLVGDVTRGASGNPVEREVPELNVRYTLSTWMAFDDQKHPLENVGISPRIRIPATASYDEERDYVLETAIALIRGGSSSTLGIPDSWVLQHRLNLTETSDADGDGLIDRHEYAAGTDPTDPRSTFRVLSLRRSDASPGWTVRWSSVAGKRYALRKASNIAAASPFDVVVQRNVLGTGAETSFTDSASAVMGPGPWFYRVELEEEP